MQVFKAYFKIIKKNLPQMLIYFVIFIALSIAFLNAGVGSETTVFEESKPNIAVFDRNQTNMTIGLTSFLGEYSNLISLEDDEETIRDALFYRKVSYILIIPEGTPFRLERLTVPDSYTSSYMDRLIDNYLKTYEAYQRFLPVNSSIDIATRVRENLDKSVEVNLENFGEKTVLTDNSIYYFNYFGYSLFAVILLGVCSFMLTFQDADLRRRNACTPIKARSMNMQLIAGNSVFALASWFIMYGISFILFGFQTLQTKAFYYGINTFVFMIVCISMSFLVANLIKSKSAQPAVVNVLSMGLSFLSGVFVPQFLLGKTVLRIASFAPTYWYVRANHIINVIDNTKDASLSAISKELFIQLAFSLVFLVVSVLIIRHRRTATN